MSNGTPAVLKSLRWQQKKSRLSGFCINAISLLKSRVIFSIKYVFTLNKLIHTFLLDGPLKIHVLLSLFSKFRNLETLLFIRMPALRKF